VVENYTSAEYALMGEHLDNQYWRLNNLYYILDEHGQRVIFKMRPVQEWLFYNMTWRQVILKARQLGFTTFVDILFLDFILFNDNLRAGIIADTRQDAEIIFRDKVKFAYDNLPEFIKMQRVADQRTAGEILLSNNSSIRVSSSLRSATGQLLHVTEFGKLSAKYPQKAREIITGALPAMHRNSLIVFEGTAEGRDGAFFNMCDVAQKQHLTGKPLSRLDLKYFFFPWYQNPSYTEDPTHVDIPARLKKYFKKIQTEINVKFTRGQKAWYTKIECGATGLGSDMWREHPSTPDEAFAVSVIGAYYDEELKAAYGEGRIDKFPFNKNYPVHTAWDIGAECTAIWFFQLINDMIFLIDYYEDVGPGMGHYVEVLGRRSRELGYNYERYIGPHDLGNEEWGVSKTRIETARETYGINFEVLHRYGLADGIEAAKQVLPHCFFDSENCVQMVERNEDFPRQAVGLASLESYRKKWSPAGDWMNKPLHDWASHGADAFRYMALAIGLERTGMLTNSLVKRCRL